MRQAQERQERMRCERAAQQLRREAELREWRICNMNAPFWQGVVDQRWIDDPDGKWGHYYFIDDLVKADMSEYLRSLEKD